MVAKQMVGRVHQCRAVRGPMIVRTKQQNSSVRANSRACTVNPFICYGSAALRHANHLVTHRSSFWQRPGSRYSQTPQALTHTTAVHHSYHSVHPPLPPPQNALFTKQRVKFSAPSAQPDISQQKIFPRRQATYTRSSLPERQKLLACFRAAPCPPRLVSPVEQVRQPNLLSDLVRRYSKRLSTKLQIQL